MCTCERILHEYVCAVLYVCTAVCMEERMYVSTCVGELCGLWVWAPPSTPVEYLQNRVGFTLMWEQELIQGIKPRNLYFRKNMEYRWEIRGSGGTRWLDDASLKYWGWAKLYKCYNILKYKYQSKCKCAI